MKRYNVYLSGEQIKNLEEIQKKNGLSRSEIIRKSIDEFTIGYLLPFDFREFSNKVSLCNDMEELKHLEYEAFEETLEFEHRNEIRKRLFDIVRIQGMKIMARGPKDKSTTDDRDG